MPSINRIRVNNVKYNFGTQQYDDFTMRMYGKNTLYDLANGGGKSILMLLLLQNLIPNCTLDEKQPIEKLFRTGGGNTTIHSLVEWKLDEPDIREGYRYMTTGFCARKAKDSPDEEEGGKEMAAIEYFNYCIFYRDFNDNDIINLPLVKDGERVSYSGWKNYLKELGRRDLKLEVHVFERKGEYQRFISRYGLYESHWEIIRGINKTEGHVRTYFETNYKTARKVVEDLLIEEIIEKAYLVKIDKNDSSDDMAHTLLEIKDKLVELARKKREIADYDRQTELLHVLEARVSAFLELYENQAKQCSNIADVCVTGSTVAKNSEEKMAELELRKEEQLSQMNRQRLVQESLKIKRDKLLLEELLEDIRILQEEIATEEASVVACQNELNRKESMNDYLDYWKDKTVKEENEAVIEASLHQNEDQLGELQALAARKKQQDDQALEEIRSALGKEEQQAAEAKEQTERLERLERETEVILAVAEHEYQQVQERNRKNVQEMQDLRGRLSESSFLNPEELLQEQEQQQNGLQNAVAELEQQLRQDRQTYYDWRQEVSGLSKQLENQESRLEQLELQDKTYREQSGTLKRMLEIYVGDSSTKTTEWMTNQDITGLIQSINNRYLNNIAMISAKKELLAKGQKRLQQLEEGRLIAPTQAVEKAKYYIESRHGMDALFGMDYLAAQTEEVRQQLLASHPLLPYGLLVENFMGLDTDAKLRELNLGDGFLPIFNLSMLNDLTTDGENDCVMYLQRGSQAFVSNQTLEQETARQKAELEELKEEVARLEEMSITYQEDSAFAAGLQGIAIMDVENERVQAQDALRECKEALQTKKQELSALQRDLEAKEQELVEKRQAYYHWLEDRGTLESIATLSRQMADDEQKQQSNKAEVTRLQNLKNQYQQELYQSRLAYSDSQHRVQALQEQLTERLADWEKYYKEYFAEVTIPTDIQALSEAELDARFKAAKAVFEKSTIVLEDKKQLIAALQTSMDKALRAIAKRNSKLEELEELRKNHQLYAVDEQELELLSSELSRLSLVVDTKKHHLEGRKQKANRLEGSIEQAMMTLEERFGTYEDVLVSKEEIAGRITEGEALLARLDQAYKDSEKAYQQYSKEYTAMLDLYKDVKRIVETNEISLQNAQVLSVDKEQLREVFETSLLAYDKSTKTLERAKNELQRYKNQTAQALVEMQAFELSQTISQDVEIPGNFGEAKQLRDNLASIINVIALEKERVEQGIEDMQFIKSNFEKQCIQRCQDVKNELEKLPKLSRIMLEGEPIQMVGLNISYVKDEFIPQRMSDYIDDVVKGADRFQNQNERIKYIRSRLELKKLFSVIVTDMNNIKLTLYKRERMKEQSRYLRYEEAVGSTGQSQGIYIQFLVSIINYISGLHSPSGENDKLMKTIFIDNPFGAAKDVYIWEPIFALLKTNHVQLIVPARGATPAITARFDVNYILGQQMVGKRQQTVVVDYRSQVEQEEVEYRNLEYEQVSFDFI
ncbi:MAG: hypothetical protein IJ040_04665 [Lachnospiraceae bacterium]|nr:hypothetical protein [Lachnospiraceae bacterium]